MPKINKIMSKPCKACGGLERNKQKRCVFCRNETQKKSRIKCREKLKIRKHFDYEKNKDRYLNAEYKRKYGISLEQYNTLLFFQDDCCAICGTNQSNFSKKLSIDHDHKTGKIRGLLCRSCNLLLSDSKDSVEILSSAVGYLKDNL